MLNLGEEGGRCEDSNAFITRGGCAALVRGDIRPPCTYWCQLPMLALAL